LGRYLQISIIKILKCEGPKLNPYGVTVLEAAAAAAAVAVF
jgi:hypothetical protein